MEPIQHEDYSLEGKTGIEEYYSSSSEVKTENRSSDDSKYGDPVCTKC